MSGSISSVSVPQGHEPSQRTKDPLTLSLTSSLPNGFGVEAAYNVTDRVALAAGASTSLAAHNLGAQVRLYPIAFKESSIYMAGGAQYTRAQVYTDKSVIALTGEVGYEHRPAKGYTIGVGVGGMLTPTGACPTIGLRIGKSF